MHGAGYVPGSRSVVPSDSKTVQAKGCNFQGPRKRIVCVAWGDMFAILSYPSQVDLLVRVKVAEEIVWGLETSTRSHP